MGNSVLILVSDDSEMIEGAKSFAGRHEGLIMEVYSSSQWEEWTEKNMKPSPEKTDINKEKEQKGGTVLPFPPGANRLKGSRQVCTMNELESVAIRNAIFEFKGNLAEASRALGIGRATLYRKVKQYNIDPSEARRRRAAA